MNCTMCPHKCNVDRMNIKGRCKAGIMPTISLVSLHKYEEPCISFKKGSGTIFFSGCNLNCVFCQNSDISQKIYGKEVTVQRLADIMIEQQVRGAENINLVTPSIYVMQIRDAIILAKQKGLNIPIVYNTSSYDNLSSIKLLDGLIDIYLPDFKYAKNELGEKYSKVKNYTDIATLAINEMIKQCGMCKFSSDGKMLKGVIIRHLVLPNNISNTKDVLDIIKEKWGTSVYVSIMAQYFPTYLAKTDGKYADINRKITSDELNEVEQYLFECGFENGYIQELGEHEEEYVPEFNLDNIE